MRVQNQLTEHIPAVCEIHCENIVSHHFVPQHRLFSIFIIPFIILCFFSSSLNFIYFILSFFIYLSSDNHCALVFKGRVRERERERVCINHRALLITWSNSHLLLLTCNMFHIYLFLRQELTLDC